MGNQRKTLFRDRFVSCFLFWTYFGTYLVSHFGPKARNLFSTAVWISILDANMGPQLEGPQSCSDIRSRLWVDGMTARGELHVDETTQSTKTQISVEVRRTGQAREGWT